MDGIPENLPHSWVMNARYHTAAAAAGALPVTIPLLEEDPDTLRAVYDRLDGLLLDFITASRMRSSRDVDWCGMCMD